MSAFLTRCTVWLAVLLLFAVAGGLSAGAPGFWGVLATGLAGWLGFHLYHVALLLRWLRAPRPECIPEGLGSWQQVFSALYRQARQQQFHQKKLSSTLERFINAGEAMPDGVVVLDDSDRIEWINPMAVEHLGLDRQRDVGNLIANLVRQPGFHAFLTAEQHSQPLILHLTQPHELVLSVQLVPFDSTRKLLLSRDITQLDRVQTVHRDFVANVSHELRTPLTVIGGFVETLSDMEAPGPDILRQFLPLMMEQARRMQVLVEDLLTLSRLESGGKSQPFERIGMSELLHTLKVEAEGLSHGRHHVELAICTPCDLWGAPNELHSALGNLVSNAVRYTPDGGRIRLLWQMQGGRAVFSVEDNGIGIAREHIPRLTERFYRVDRGRSRSTGGTGLGLAIVKHILARHSARLEVDSEPERGSVFSAVFPPERLAEPSNHEALTGVGPSKKPAG